MPITGGRDILPADEPTTPQIRRAPMSMPSLASQALPAGHVARADRAALRHIPGDEGWPVVGRTFNVLADPLGEARRMAKRFGPVYRSRLLGETSIALLGPEANEFVYL
ncbi:unnamed protein product, partial [marine sediment metagenome]